MRCHYSCKTDEHVLARRQFLGTLAAGSGAIIGGLGAATHPAAAAHLASNQKRMIVYFMSGGMSQLESWDPKPGTDTGGPFRAIPTSVPGIHLSELLPMTAKQMHHLAIVRSVNTKQNDHGKGRYMMTTGRKQSPADSFPQLGAVVAKAMTTDDNPIPGHINITPSGSGGRGNDASYLGPKYASISLGGGKPPANSARDKSLSVESDAARDALRRRVNDRFALRRRTAQTDAYVQSYDKARQLMQRRDVFDISKESEKSQDRYGQHDLGRQSLLARRLLENGATFIQVIHSNYDTHNENFNFHIEQLGEFDRSFSALVEDLADRGMLDSTLIVVMSEFGRTPRINARYGRDHWGTAWSVLLGGAGIQRGALYGKTNKNGTAVADKEVNHCNLFHTYLSAVGLDSAANFNIGGRPIPMANPAFGPIDDLLS